MRTDLKWEDLTPDQQQMLLLITLAIRTSGVVLNQLRDLVELPK